MNESLFSCPQNTPVERPPLLLENLPHNPYQLLREVFLPESASNSLKALPLHWISQFENEQPTPDDPRFPLNEFYQSLLCLIEALQFIESENSIIHSLGLTTMNQAKCQELDVHPMAIVYHFCHQYPQVYTRRELWCSTHAMFENTSETPAEFQPADILDWYEQILALTETAYALSSEISPPHQNQFN